MSKPLSFAMAWMTWAVWMTTGLLGAVIVMTGLGAAAAASKAFALATSRAGIGNSFI